MDGPKVTEPWNWWKFLSKMFEKYFQMDAIPSICNQRSLYYYTSMDAINRVWSFEWHRMTLAYVIRNSFSYSFT